jgi:hypothetical protein
MLGISIKLAFLKEWMGFECIMFIIIKIMIRIENIELMKRDIKIPIIKNREDTHKICSIGSIFVIIGALIDFFIIFLFLSVSSIL